MPSDRQLAEGDYLWTDFRSTFAAMRGPEPHRRCGNPASWESKCYATVRSLTLSCAARSGPGRQPGHLPDFERCGERAPGSGLWRASRIGHGGGLEVTEPPSIAPWSQELIEVGMILHLEPKLERDEPCSSSKRSSVGCRWRRIPERLFPGGLPHRSGLRRSSTLKASMTKPMFTSIVSAPSLPVEAPRHSIRVRNRAALNLLDTIASAAGARDRRTRATCAKRQCRFRRRTSAVWFTDARRHPAAALLANCAAASALDIDEWPSRRHGTREPPSCGLLQEAMLHRARSRHHRRNRRRLRRCLPHCRSAPAGHSQDLLGRPMGRLWRRGRHRWMRRLDPKRYPMP